MFANATLSMHITSNTTNIHISSYLLFRYLFQQYRRLLGAHSFCGSTPGAWRNRHHHRRVIASFGKWTTAQLCPGCCCWWWWWWCYDELFELRRLIICWWRPAIYSSSCNLISMNWTLTMLGVDCVALIHRRVNTHRPRVIVVICW